MEKVNRRDFMKLGMAVGAVVSGTIVISPAVANIKTNQLQPKEDIFYPMQSVTIEASGEYMVAVIYDASVYPNEITLNGKQMAHLPINNIGHLSHQYASWTLVFNKGDVIAMTQCSSMNMYNI